MTIMKQFSNKLTSVFRCHGNLTTNGQNMSAQMAKKKKKKRKPGTLKTHVTQFLHYIMFRGLQIQFLWNKPRYCMGPAHSSQCR